MNQAVCIHEWNRYTNPAVQNSSHLSVKWSSLWAWYPISEEGFSVCLKSKQEIQWRGKTHSSAWLKIVGHGKAQMLFNKKGTCEGLYDVQCAWYQGRHVVFWAVRMPSRSCAKVIRISQCRPLRISSRGLRISTLSRMITQPPGLRSRSISTIITTACLHLKINK